MLFQEDDETTFLASLMTACKSGNAAAVEELLEAMSGLDINQSDQVANFIDAC